MTTSIPSNTLEKFVTFGDLLRFLRRRTGLTQLELATAVGYSNSQISRLEQNERLPDIPTIKARFVYALGIEDEAKVVARLLDLAGNMRREDAPAPGASPYKGLNFFDESDADLFVGREALTAKLTELVLSLASHTQDDETARFLAIVGASGSGKSSLVRAGLVSALRWNQSSTDWHVLVLTPTSRPLESLASALTQESSSAIATASLMDDLVRDERSLQISTRRMLGSKNGSRLLLVVDQFEELFALCRSEPERSSFISNLLMAASETDGPVIVVITLRADFYAPCANYPRLREALAQYQEYIGAMNDEEMRRAIEEPAQRGRWELEPGLVDLLLHDVGHEPGALPLLSHALFETWQRRRGRTMTLSGYTSSGGVRGAIAETAETVFTDQFTREQRSIARRIFLRLTELGDEISVADTRRRARFDELILKPEEASITQAVLKALADARLITTTEDSAEVAHEALIREWPTLRSWLEENREGLRLHHQLTEAAQEWQAFSRAPDVLYRGARLTQTGEWAATHEQEMNALEREFLAASTEAAELDAREREAQRQRELESAHKLAEAEKRRADMESQRAEEQVRTSAQLRKRAYYLAGAFTIALVLAAAAIFFGKQTQVTSRHATSRELASASLANLDIDPERSILLALRAVSLSTQNNEAPLLEAQDALHRAVQASRVRFTLPGHKAGLIGLAYSPDGTHLATYGEDNRLKIWDPTTGTELISISVSKLTPNVYRRPSFSPDGKRVAAGVDNLAKVWNVTSGKELLSLEGHTGEVKTVVFSPDGKRIASASWDGTVIVWDALTGDKLLTLSGQNEFVNDVAFSADGAYLASVGSGAEPTDASAAVIWDAISGEPVLTLPMLGEVDAVAFSPDGGTLATGAGDSTWSVWDVSTGKKLFTGFGHNGVIEDISFDKTGARVVTADDDGTAKIWEAATGRELLTLRGHAGGVVSADFSPDGVYVGTAGRDGVAKIWDVSPAGGGEWFNLVGHTGPVLSVAYSPNGKYIATGSVDFTAKIWDAQTGKVLHTMTTDGGIVNLFFTPDSAQLVTVSAASFGDQKPSTAGIWDVATGNQLRGIRGPFTADAALSPDGKSLATTILGGAIKVWDTKAGQEVRTLMESQSNAQPLAYSPDGKYLAAGSYDEGVVRIWDSSTGRHVKTLNVGGQIISIVYSHSGKLIAVTGEDATVKVWDITEGTQLFSLTGHTGFTYGVAFSPDDRYLASSSADGTAKIWNVADNFTSQPLTLYGHTNALFGIAFSPDGARFVTASRDGTARVYAFKIEDLVVLARHRVTRFQTQAECQQYLHIEQCPSTP